MVHIKHASNNTYPTPAYRTWQVVEPPCHPSSSPSSLSPAQCFSACRAPAAVWTACHWWPPADPTRRGTSADTRDSRAPSLLSAGWWTGCRLRSLRPAWLGNPRKRNKAEPRHYCCRKSISIDTDGVPFHLFVWRPSPDLPAVCSGLAPGPDSHTRWKTFLRRRSTAAPSSVTRQRCGFCFAHWMPAPCWKVRDDVNMFNLRVTGWKQNLLTWVWQVCPWCWWSLWTWSRSSPLTLSCWESGPAATRDPRRAGIWSSARDPPSPSGKMKESGDEWQRQENVMKKEEGRERTRKVNTSNEGQDSPEWKRITFSRFSMSICVRAVVCVLSVSISLSSCLCDRSRSAFSPWSSATSFFSSSTLELWMALCNSRSCRDEPRRRRSQTPRHRIKGVITPHTHRLSQFALQLLKAAGWALQPLQLRSDVPELLLLLSLQVSL